MEPLNKKDLSFTYRSYFVKNDTLGRAAAKGKLHQHLLHLNPKLEASIDKFLSILHQDPLGEELNTEDDVQDCEVGVQFYLTTFQILRG